MKFSQFRLRLCCSFSKYSPSIPSSSRLASLETERIYSKSFLLIRFKDCYLLPTKRYETVIF